MMKRLEVREDSGQTLVGVTGTSCTGVLRLTASLLRGLFHANVMRHLDMVTYMIQQNVTVMWFLDQIDVFQSLKGGPSQK